MAPIKFEENIKDKLEARRIEPSIRSWDQLSKQLDREERGSKNKFWLLAIAASFLLILFTVLQVAKSPEDALPQDHFSIEESSNLELQNEPKTKEKSLLKSDELDSTQVVEVKDIPDVRSNSKRVHKTNTSYVVENRVMLKEHDNLKENKSPFNVESMEVSDAIASKDMEKSVIKEALQESKNTDVMDIDRETDSLLKAAQKELLLDKAMMKNTSMVDAKGLLLEVEDEVEPSLKSKVYEVFKGGFKKVKTAVAQRNN